MYEYLSSSTMFNQFLSKFSGESDEPFILEVTNSAPTTKSFYLSQGLNYTRGAETPGQLRTGTFPAISDAGSSLTASTQNSVSIEQFIAYMQSNPTKIWRIEATTTNPTGQLSSGMQSYREGAIKNEVPTIDPFRKYADGNQYNLQFQTFKPKYISSQDIVTMPVAANSTLTLNIYPEVSRNDRTALENDVNSVKKTISEVAGEAAQFVPIAQSAISDPQSAFKKMSTTQKVLLASAVLLVLYWTFKPKLL